MRLYQRYLFDICFRGLYLPAVLFYERESARLFESRVIPGRGFKPVNSRLRRSRIHALSAFYARAFRALRVYTRSNIGVTPSLFEAEGGGPHRRVTTRRESEYVVREFRELNAPAEDRNSSRGANVQPVVIVMR